MTYYIECTHTVQTLMNSGIQRVVRNIVSASLPGAWPVDTCPVYYRDGAFYAIEGGIPYPDSTEPPMPGFRHRVRVALANTARKLVPWVRRTLLAVLPFEGARKFIEAPRSEFGLSRLGLYPLIKLGLIQAHAPKPPGPPLPVEPRPGDTLLLLDSSWHLNLWPGVHDWKAQGARIVVTVYDLIPYLNPEFCHESLVPIFNDWLDTSANTADVIVAISKSVAHEVRERLPALIKDGKTLPRVTHFWLGSELDGAKVCRRGVRPEVEQLLASDVPTYIYVSTVEPRKNHGYALDAFDLLWQQGVRAHFVIIGRVGWKCEQFVERVQHHEQYGKQLFMFNDVGDFELARMYDQANGLIFTSHTEGFGLPVVEGLQRGLPVFASDIPVFREIGRAGVQFVDLGDPASLTAALARHIRGHAPRLPAPVEWLTWKESALQLFDRIEHLPARLPQPSEERVALVA